MTARTYLFVPGDNEQRLAKAPMRGANGVIADLEDGVAPSAKGAARAIVARWLAAPPEAAVERWVRVNADESLGDDVGALSGTSLTGIVLPKVHGPEDVVTALDLLGASQLGTAGVIPLIETAASLMQLHDIARVAGVRQLMIGEMDLGAELGLAPNSPAWTTIRTQVVIASAAAGLPGPIGPVDADFADLDRLRRETRQLYDMGYRSRAAIHPAQIPAFTESLAPESADVARAREVVDAYAAALAEGRGAATDADGRMIDEANVSQARRILAEAGEFEPS